VWGYEGGGHVTPDSAPVICTYFGALLLEGRLPGYTVGTSLAIDCNLFGEQVTLQPLWDFECLF